MTYQNNTISETIPTTFYRIPKALFADSCFREISLSAKMLYGMLLDRMTLSTRNAWQDGDGQVFVYFTLEEAQEQLGCGHSKAVRLFAELESSGLIRRKRQGQGKPTKIYVENLLGEVFFPETQNDGNEETAWEEQPSPSESQTSALPENILPDFPEPDANKTEKNDTEMSETDRIYPPYTPPFLAGPPR